MVSKSASATVVLQLSTFVKIEGEMREQQTPARIESAATGVCANDDLEGGDELASSVIEQPLPNKVPRSKRRGFLGRCSLLAEIQEPKHYPRSTKWYITFVVSLAGATAPLASTVIFRT